jgi:transposase-like protein
MSNLSSNCKICPECSEGNGAVIKYGFFKRGTGHIPRVQRYYCKSCKLAFSAQTGALSYRERKPHLTQSILRIAMESVSQRGCARVLGCQPITVARKIVRLGVRAEFHLKARTAIDIANGEEQLVIFDDMETFEHSKCKPISITLAVAASTRQIVAVKASEMRAKGLLSKIAKKRYGPRKDHRSKALRKVLGEAAVSKPCQAQI